jgi:hypothetical protein
VERLPGTAASNYKNLQRIRSRLLWAGRTPPPGETSLRSLSLSGWGFLVHFRKRRLDWMVSIAAFPYRWPARGQVLTQVGARAERWAS